MGAGGMAGEGGAAVGGAGGSGGTGGADGDTPSTLPPTDDYSDYGPFEFTDESGTGPGGADADPDAYADLNCYAGCCHP